MLAEEKITPSAFILTPAPAPRNGFVTTNSLGGAVCHDKQLIRSVKNCHLSQEVVCHDKQPPSVRLGSFMRFSFS